MRMLLPINLKKWIDEHRHLLKPPVGNQVVYKDAEFIIMVVGGPNIRKDYHVNKGEEFFYQLEGNMVLRIREKGKPKDIPINEGEIFLLSPNIPHSPQRFENTVGLVIERKRHVDELDGFQWYCDECHAMLYDKYISLTDIVKQLPPLFEEFWSNEDARKCKKCNAILNKP
ncbi:MAG: 3-hydroxyanthranilate 3,4-dioxygenase [Candidatus Neomarinimicrobiota bacterium]|nr:3-hydroxyanthranilate 3,4-dioxygenase [Candidatus Neomarinimicrobiota bacterium]